MNFSLLHGVNLLSMKAQVGGEIKWIFAPPVAQVAGRQNGCEGLQNLRIAALLANNPVRWV
jgi:hypothetical protein